MNLQGTLTELSVYNLSFGSDILPLILQYNKLTFDNLRPFSALKIWYTTEFGDQTEVFGPQFCSL